MRPAGATTGGRATVAVRLPPGRVAARNPGMAEGVMREERKVVTALFADLAGSTELTERLDPEDARELLGEGVRRIVEAVEAFGGTVKDLASDGRPCPHRRPGRARGRWERAVRAGLRIVSVRVDIESGLVVLGPVGGGSRVE